MTSSPCGPNAVAPGELWPKCTASGLGKPRERGVTVKFVVVVVFSNLQSVLIYFFFLDRRIMSGVFF